MASRQVTVAKTAPTTTPPTGPVLLWETTSGVTPDPAVDVATGIFRAGTFTDPTPITVTNTSATHILWVSQGPSAASVSKTNGTPIYPKGSVTFNVVGNDQLWGVATTASCKVSVTVGRQ